MSQSQDKVSQTVDLIWSLFPTAAKEIRFLNQLTQNLEERLKIINTYKSLLKDKEKVVAEKKRDKATIEKLQEETNILRGGKTGDKKRKRSLSPIVKKKEKQGRQIF